MNTSTLYTPEQVKELVDTIRYQATDKCWLPLRPMGWQGLALRHRLKAAWKVFTGQWDTLSWEEKDKPTIKQQ